MKERESTIDAAHFGSLIESEEKSRAKNKRNAQQMRAQNKNKYHGLENWTKSKSTKKKHTHIYTKRSCLRRN